MRRFGFSIVLLIFFVFTAGIGSCTEGKYSEEDMGQVATFVRVVMDIVSSDYIDKDIPPEITKTRIKEIVIGINTDFEELDLLDKYEMIIVSNGVEIATVIWDPGNNRKLMQDLRCTPYVDEPSWRSEIFGNAFTLDWSICDR